MFLKFFQRLFAKQKTEENIISLYLTINPEQNSGNLEMQSPTQSKTIETEILFATENAPILSGAYHILDRVNGQNLNILNLIPLTGEAAAAANTGYTSPVLVKEGSANAAMLRKTPAIIIPSKAFELIYQSLANNEKIIIDALEDITDVTDYGDPIPFEEKNEHSDTKKRRKKATIEDDYSSDDSMTQALLLQDEINASEEDYQQDTPGDIKDPDEKTDENSSWTENADNALSNGGTTDDVITNPSDDTTDVATSPDTSTWTDDSSKALADGGTTDIGKTSQDASETWTDDSQKALSDGGTTDTLATGNDASGQGSTWTSNVDQALSDGGTTDNFQGSSGGNSDSWSPSGGAYN